MIGIDRIISGGQTGADRAALDAAIAGGVAHGGAIPAGRKTEAGPLPEYYRMEVLDSAHYPDRTEKNVRDADGTLIVSHGALSGGSALTAVLADRWEKPCLHIDLDQPGDQPLPARVIAWLAQHRIRVLNVAGPRASSDPRIYNDTRQLLDAIISDMRGLDHGGS